MTDDGQAAYLACDLVTGTRLFERVSRRLPLPVTEALNLIVQIADGLAYLHRQGLVHGDLRPHNILISSRGEAKVSDYGLWSAFLASRVTEAEWLERAAPYLAPERFQSDQATAQSDVYSLGVILYQMLTGRLPFEGQRVGDIAHLHSTAPVPLSSGLNPAVPLSVDTLILRAMAKTPAQRFESADAFRIAVQEALADWEEKPLVRAPVPEPVSDFGSFESPAQRQVSERTWWDRLGSVGGLLLGGIASAVALLVLLYFLLIGTVPEEVIVPELKGINLSEAQVLVREKGLSLVIVGRRSESGTPAGQILEVVDPLPGTKVRQGRVVRVIVSQPPKPVLVPDVTGLPARQAADQLTAKGLTVGEKVYGHSQTIASGLVLGQQPPPGSEVEPQTPVNLIISRGPLPKGQDPDWSSLGKRVVAARILITVGGTKVSQSLRIVTTDSTGTKEVYRRVHAPGDQIEFIATGTDFLSVEVYADGEKIHSQEVRPEGAVW